MKIRLVEYTDEVKRSVARKLGKEVEEITFVGIHNRRTVLSKENNYLKRISLIIFKIAGLHPLHGGSLRHDQEPLQQEVLQGGNGVFQVRK